jgi:hypothetical protein
MNPEIDVFGGMAGGTHRNGMCTVFRGKEAAVDSCVVMVH